MLMQPKGNISILRRILRRARDLYLVETYPARTLPGDVVVTDGSDIEVPQRKVVHIMRTMGFEHVRLQQGVMNDTVQRDPMIRKDVLVVLEVLPQFRLGGILQPRLELL